MIMSSMISFVNQITVMTSHKADFQYTDQARSQAHFSGVAKLLRRSLGHTLCYQNQTDNVCPEETELSSMSQRSGVRVQGEAQSKFQEISPLLERKSSKIDC